MRVTLYARVGVETDPPIEEQFATLRAWAAAAGHEVVAEFSDANLTAVRSRDPRPGQDNASRWALRGLTDMVAAVSLDRLGRSLPHLIGLMREFDSLGVGLYVADLDLDTTTERGRIMHRLMAGLDSFQKAIWGENVRRGQRKARTRGTRIGRPRLAPSTEAKIAAMLKAGVCPNRIRTLTHCGKAPIYRIKRELEGCLPPRT